MFSSRSQVPRRSPLGRRRSCPRPLLSCHRRRMWRAGCLCLGIGRPRRPGPDGEPSYRMRRSPARPARGVDRGKGRGLGTVVGGSSPLGAPIGCNMDSGGQARDVGSTIKKTRRGSGDSRCRKRRYGEISCEAGQCAGGWLESSTALGRAVVPVVAAWRWLAEDDLSTCVLRSRVYIFLQRVHRYPAARNDAGPVDLGGTPLTSRPRSGPAFQTRHIGSGPMVQGSGTHTHYCVPM